MSYLSSVRLHFAGQFQANISTVNNDPGHFDNASFVPSYQQMQGPNFDPPNGWFNPAGDAAFRLLGCQVTSAWLPSGQVTNDPVLGFLVADSDTKVCAKLVDLDSEQQLVSEIWGLQVRIADTNGNTLLRGDYEPAAFADIWNRATGAGSGSDIGAGAMYQSVLRNLEWNNKANASPFLMGLRRAASDGLLSIKFNVDGLNMDFTSPNFMCGRIVGTIGPASAAEPVHMVLGRQFMAASPPQQGFFAPPFGINFLAGSVSETDGCIYLDLGNALSTPAPGAGMNDLGDLTLAVFDPKAKPEKAAGSATPLGVISSAGPNGYASDPTWYNRTAGVVSLPLTAAQLASVSQAPLVLYVAASLSTKNPVFIAEWNTGAFLRADKFVFRLSPEDRVQIPVYATQWGRPFAGATVNFVADNSQLQPSNNIDPNDVPGVGEPLDALKFASSALTNSQGIALLTLKTSDPGTPRYFNQGQDYGLDGQVYGIRPNFADQRYMGAVNVTNFISVLLWSGFKPSNPVTWDDLQPIFQQYANLYPVMSRFLNLADYDAVVANRDLLSLVFGLDPANPNAMPVTRDLSPAKRTAILSWLQNPLPGTKSAAAKREPVTAAAAPELSRKTQARDLSQGGKAAAMARRLVLRE
jgi:hypothetical protein